MVELNTTSWLQQYSEIIDIQGPKNRFRKRSSHKYWIRMFSPVIIADKLFFG